ncbi:MAG: hypothetical protein ABWY45_15870 [Mycobacterium sp.]
MSENWLSIWMSHLVRVAESIASWATQAPFREPWDDDADRRREFRDLDAIRVHFPDHA